MAIVDNREEIKEKYIVPKLGYLKVPQSFKDVVGSLLNVKREPVTKTIKGKDPDGAKFVQITYTFYGLPEEVFK